MFCLYRAYSISHFLPYGIGSAQNLLRNDFVLVCGLLIFFFHAFLSWHAGRTVNALVLSQPSMKWN